MTTEGAYDHAIEMAARCMVTAARADQFATAAQVWMLEALRLRGGLADGEWVDRTVLRDVLEDAVSMAVAKSMDEPSPTISEHSGEAVHVEVYADDLRQNLQRIAERFRVTH